jgi:hypothetical protein
MAEGDLMQRFNIVLWKWSQDNMPGAYSPDYVNVMVEMLKRNLQGVSYRIVCITDDPHGIVGCETAVLWGDASHLANASGPHRLPSCYRRLRLYDRNTQHALGMADGERIVSIDLDAVVCGQLKSLLETEGKFVGWKLAAEFHPWVYNGSFQMFNCGHELQHIWSDFDPNTSPLKAKHAGFKGSDQAWLSMNLIGKEGSNDVPYPDMASYPIHVAKMGVFATKSRLVFFHGRRKPWSPETRAASPWVSRYWY